jgi:hypothetical protein
LDKNLFESYAQLRLIRHDLLIVRNAVVGIVGVGWGRGVFLISVAFIFSIGFSSFTRALKSDFALPAETLVLLGFAIGIATFLYSHRRLSFFRTDSNLAGSAFTTRENFTLRIAIGLTLTLFAAPLIIFVIIRFDAINRFGVVILYFTSAFLGHAIGSFTIRQCSARLKKWHIRTRPMLSSLPRTGCDKRRILRLARLVFVQKIPFARSLGSAIIGLIVTTIVGSCLLCLVLIKPDWHSFLPLPILFLLIILGIISRLDYSVIRFTSAMGNSIILDIITHLLPISLYFVILTTSLSIAANHLLAKSWYVILILWSVSNLILAVRICQYRLMSKARADAILQFDIVCAAMLCLAIIPAGIAFLLVRWGIVFHKATQSSWLLE